MTRPIVPPIRAEESPTIIAVRAPKMMRDNRSRPNWSVPSKCCQLGASIMAPKSLAVGRQQLGGEAGACDHHHQQQTKRAQQFAPEEPKQSARARGPLPAYVLRGDRREVDRASVGRHDGALPQLKRMRGSSQA